MDFVVVSSELPHLICMGEVVGGMSTNYYLMVELAPMVVEDGKSDLAGQNVLCGSARKICKSLP